MGEYRKRVSDKVIGKKLKAKGAVLIEGAKWCGKTTSAEQFAKSSLYMSMPENLRSNLELADINPSRLLEGETPRLIDEWQLAPKLWDAARWQVDHRGGAGHFILTGSAVPVQTEQILHTGTGRFAWVRMRTMSLYESGDSTGEVSLGELFRAPEAISAENRIDIDRLAFLTCRGGWPNALDLDDGIALEQAFDYVDAVVKSDIVRVDGIKRDEDRARRIMQSYARHQGTQAAAKVIMEDVAARDFGEIADDTLYSYVNALRKIFVIEDMPAWNPNLRSKTAIRTSDTRYFTDPSMASAILGLSPGDLLDDLNYFGLLFETLCVRDLRVFAESMDGKVSHYRDKSGLECDAVVHLRDGSYGLVEIKLGGDRLMEEGAANLKKLAGKIDTDRMKEPSFLMLLTGAGKYAYRRKDGIYVVPIGVLRE